MQKAEILIEALPYIEKFTGKTFVIKYGGSLMENDDLKKKFIEDVALLKLVGINIVIVHGGGKRINTMLDRVNLDVKFEGYRRKCYRHSGNGFIGSDKQGFGGFFECPWFECGRIERQRQRTVDG